MPLNFSPSARVQLHTKLENTKPFRGAGALERIVRLCRYANGMVHSSPYDIAKLPHLTALRLLLPDLPIHFECEILGSGLIIFTSLLSDVHFDAIITKVPINFVII